MARLSLFSLVAAAVLVANVSAAPWPASSKFATHRSRSVGEKRDLGVEAYFPKASFEVRLSVSARSVSLLKLGNV